MAHDTPAPPPPPPTPILIIGAGPVGLFLALLLAQANLPVLLLEASTSPDPAPKAMTHLPSILPDFRAAGVYDALVAAARGLVDQGICFRDAQTGVVLAEMPRPGKGVGEGPLTVPQPTFCNILRQKLQEFPHVTLRAGVAVKSLTQQRNGVEVLAEAFSSSPSSSDTLTFTARYVVAADGAHSAVRTAAGIPFEGATLPRRLVACDVRYDFTGRAGWVGGNFLAGREWAGLVGPILAPEAGAEGEGEDEGDGVGEGIGEGVGNGKGKKTVGLWRVSFSVPEEEWLDTPAALDALVRQRLGKMLPEGGPDPLDACTIERVAPYRAQQLCAATFRKANVLLVGDAAHLTNPYAGLGLNTGLLDASSLATVLSAHLLRGAPPQLLDAWARARRDTFVNAVDPVSRAAFWSLLDPDVATLRERHPVLRAVGGGAGGGVGGRDGAVKGKPAKGPMALRTDVRALEGWVD
ncbi:uncharacterized protein K452DRAFT_256622 [Aplosporella prunicola CBS 121167]|uniref:FAD-binding domain-containing protein n=1 Tax=Aplosporella prunicola CBS 121167 TaxID=1176127 RepID=A0A6A6B587_9PEZI|nr:uncharacterized protein K452DRAFT_256622 [Aplosporella prunicola CBS 121167]KAF2138384.1 hypothetical protein K452DRAFT_256622 [Aplosporella prunicola CBS 121167]